VFVFYFLAYRKAKEKQIFAKNYVRWSRSGGFSVYRIDSIGVVAFSRRGCAAQLHSYTVISMGWADAVWWSTLRHGSIVRRRGVIAGNRRPSIFGIHIDFLKDLGGGFFLRKKPLSECLRSTVIPKML
jgi:hypothetical protein